MEFDLGAAFGDGEFAIVDLKGSAVDGSLLGEAIKRHRASCVRMTIRNGCVRGPVDFGDVSLPSLILSHVQLTDCISFRDATLASLGISNCQLRDVDLRRAIVSRGINLQHSTVGGSR